MKKIDQKFSVPFEFPVIFCRDVFNLRNPVLAETLDRLNERRQHEVIVFVDDGVMKSRPDFSSDIAKYFDAYHEQISLVTAPQIVPGGESLKNDTEAVQRVIEQLLKLRLCRHSFVLAIGGGAMLDAIGFAEALVHRGLRLVRLPTTVLAQNDSGVGVKNAINFHQVKNALGTFTPPFAVINDFAFLDTLPDREWRSGIAEAFKVAIIKDRPFFHFLTDHAEALHSRDSAAMEHLITRCAELHLEHIRTNGDPFEMGASRPLDFGHWAAHKIEVMSNYAISHGEAVAVGIALDSCYAKHLEWLSREDFAGICTGLARIGFALWFDEMDQRSSDGTRELFDGLRDFQEHLGGELCITFPEGIGARREIHQIDLALMEEALEELRLLAQVE